MSGILFLAIILSLCQEKNVLIVILVNMPDPMSFSITGSDGSVGSQNTECTTDWITIPCATNSLRPDNQSGGSPAVCVDRICGMVFNSVNSDFPSPSVPVNSK